ncbi:MAG: hypothetical protein FWC21_01565 [Treponema sp.]|nr:hypothetical protein [Treponema sp.]
MISIKRIFLYIFTLIAIIFFSGCASAPVPIFEQTRSNQRNYNFTLSNTVSVYMVNDDKNKQFFCFPIQYVFEYQMQSFDLTESFLIIGDYKIDINRNNANIYIYLDEESDISGVFDSVDFKIIYIEEKGIINLSDMKKPLPAKLSEDLVNHYYIFIERHLNENEMNAIVNEYKKGNFSSRAEIWYDIVIDNEPQLGSGIIDTFEIYIHDPTYNIPNLKFFKTLYFD